MGYSAASDTDVAVSTKADVTANSVSQLMAAVAKQPVSIAIEADKRVFYSTSCGTNLDHGVLIAGYGTDEASGLDYWLVKNSWNTVWGDEGYIKIARVEGEGICGIQMAPVYPTTN